MTNAFTSNLSTSGTPMSARTYNDAATLSTSGNPLVDLFFMVGASRGKDITPVFARSLGYDPDMTLRMVLWGRDIRGGAGEREIVRSFLRYLEKSAPDQLLRVMAKIPEVGRYDDLLVFENPQIKKVAFEILARAIQAGNGLAAKWIPRKGRVAEEFRAFLGHAPKQYRKTLVNLTKVVEQQMSAKEWAEIQYGKLPSIAAKRYRKAFTKHDAERYGVYVEGLKKGTEKINAGAIFPHDVIKPLINGTLNEISDLERDAIEAQWKALPNYMPQGAKFLPMVDVSGSMYSFGYYTGKYVKGNTRPIDVSVSLGLYCSERQTGDFKDTVLTFSGQSTIQKLNGNIIDKINQLVSMHWDMNTSLENAFKAIYDHKAQHNVPDEDMPDVLLILSDMEFDRCVSDAAQTNWESAKAKYGDSLPKVIFWNMNSSGQNFPVMKDEKGVGLVSGFSPAVIKNILGGENFSPIDIVKATLLNERYDLVA